MVKAQNLIFFQGNTQYENSGDVLINASLVTLFKAKGHFIINDSEMPEEYIVGIGIEPNERISYYNRGFILYALTSCLSRFFNRSKPKVYLIAGPPGHLFGDSLKKAARTVVSASVLFLFRLFGGKIIKIGFSVGPIGSLLAKTESFRANFVNHYLVRESLSLSFSRQIGIKKARFFPDLAWIYTPPNYKKAAVRNRIVLSFRNSITLHDKDNAYLEKLKNNLFYLLDSLDVQKFELEIIYQVKMDYQFCAKLYDELKGHYQVSFREHQIDLDNAHEVYSDAYFVLTNRLHCALLAYKYGALPIVLTAAKDHLKIRGIYGDAGIDHMILNVDRPKEDNLKALRLILGNSDRELKHIDAVSKKYSDDAQKIIDEIFN